MGQTLRKAVLTIVFLGVLLSLGGHLFLRHYTSTDQFKDWVQQQLNQLFQKDVRVEKIELRALNKVTLQRIKIIVDAADESSWIEVEQIQFKYDLLSLLRREMKLPSNLVLEAPTLSINRLNFFDSLNSFNVADLPVSLLSQLNMRGGRISFKLPQHDLPLVFANLEATLRSNIQGKLEITATAEAQGIIEGPVRLAATVNVLNKSYVAHLDFDRLNISKELPVSLEKMKGRITLEDTSLTVGPVTAVSNGWNLTLMGQAEDIRELNKLKTNLLVGRDETLFGLQVSADLVEESMSGAVQLPTATVIPFNGRVIRSAESVLFRDIKMESGYEGEGALDFSNGDYSFDFKKDLQRIRLDSNLSGEELNMRLDFNHMKAFNMDIVTATRIHFHPVEAELASEPWRLQGQIFTDYFILEHEPLHDLRGHFYLAPSGIQDLNVSWGKAFKLDGDILFRKKKPEADLNLRVHQFQLEEMEELASKPLPKNLSGALEGKLKIDGWLEKPDVFGQFTLKSGMIGRLEFDRAIIQFRGFPPYLAMTDSRIFRGRTKLYLKGALDLSLDNILHGVWIETGDKLVLWKGLALTSSDDDSNWEIKMPLPHLPPLEIVLQGEDDTHHFGSQDALQDESYVSVSPKLKF